VTLREIRDELYRAALPMELHMDPTSYVRTAYGYVRHPAIEDALAVELRDVRSAAKYAMKRYRRAWKIHPFGSVIGPPLTWRPPVKCIACNHPLTANFGGYTRRGLACPDCGFNPFMTLFYACTCGKPIPLVAQPSTDPVEVVSEIRSSMARECEHCGQRPKYERLIVRTFSLGIPWSPEEVSDEKLIEDRKALGWYSTVRDSKSAMESLLNEASRESMSSRLGAESPADESARKRTARGQGGGG
jgi:DNA-directed RNA polymerase subunit RPC12/RpoP